MKRISQAWVTLAASLAAAAVLVACIGDGDDDGQGGTTVRHELVVQVSGSGNVGSQPAGIDCGASCAALFDAATAVTLSATPAAGQVFSAWGGACSGTTPTCSLTMTQALSASATFVGASANQYALGVTVVGNGSVASTPAGIACGSTCSATYAGGTGVTLVATPAAGQTFSGWTGACSGSSTTCTLTMSEARSATATFASAPPNAGWGAPLLLSADAAGSAKVVIDAEGRAVAIWEQLDNGTATGHVWGSRYLPASGWSAPARLETNVGDVDDTHLAIDKASGKAMLIWHQLTTPGAYDLWARPFDPATGWGTAARVDTQTGTVGVSSVGIDASGNAVAVWSQIDSRNRFSVFASPYRNGAWGTAAEIETNDSVGDTDGDPIVAVAPTGEAVAVWKRSDNGVHFWSNRYTPTSGWGSAAQIVTDSGTSQSFGTHDLAIDGSGNAMLVWGQADLVGGTADWNNAIWFKRYTAGTWQSASTRVAAPVANRQGFISSPVLSLNAAGTALATWVGQDSSIVSAAAAPGSAFGAAATVRPVSSQNVTSPPSTGIASQGDSIAAWGESGTPAGVYLSQRASTGVWTAPARQETTESAADPSLAINERGNAVLVWTQVSASNGATRIFVRSYTSGR